MFHQDPKVVKYSNTQTETIIDCLRNSLRPRSCKEHSNTYNETIIDCLRNFELTKVLSVCIEKYRFLIFSLTKTTQALLHSSSKNMFYEFQAHRLTLFSFYLFIFFTIFDNLFSYLRQFIFYRKLFISF